MRMRQDLRSAVKGALFPSNIYIYIHGDPVDPANRHQKHLRPLQCNNEDNQAAWGHWCLLWRNWLSSSDCFHLSYSLWRGEPSLQAGVFDLSDDMVPGVEIIVDKHILLGRAKSPVYIYVYGISTILAHRQEVTVLQSSMNSTQEPTPGSIELSSASVRVWLARRPLRSLGSGQIYIYMHDKVNLIPVIAKADIYRVYICRKTNI